MSMAPFGPANPSEFRAAGDRAGKESEMQRAELKRKNNEAIEELRAHGALKRPWYQRLFRRSH